MQYKPQDIEGKWRERWEKDQLYKVEEDPGKEKFYVLDMFPYPSGSGLHVGHPLGYIASDIYSRYKRMKGFNVLHPMGFDAFGLPAEEYAIKTGIHPAQSTTENMKRYKEQLTSLGFSFDWSRSVQTCEHSYYKWTQWIFTLLFEHAYDHRSNKAIPISEVVEHLERNGTQDLQLAQENDIHIDSATWQGMTAKEQSDLLMNYRLAYRKIGFVNWCPELGTVLANDQVKDGVSERGGYPVIQKPMTQWYLRITAYADRLLDGLKNLEWSEALKTIQSNWIGKSQGAQVFFDTDNSQSRIEVFTTRPDTIFGATFMVLAPEHDLVPSLTTADQEEVVKQYLTSVKSKSEVERMAEKEMTGAFTGSYAIHPFTRKRIPIWLGTYVLKDYGTGAIMAVPSEDERDYRFASKYSLDIVDIIDQSEYPEASRGDKVGTLINSDFLNGLKVTDAIQKAIQEIEGQGIGNSKTNFKMRDANFSRQRYWGEPFPIVYDSQDIPEVLDMDELPVRLPHTENFVPSKDGLSPLAQLTDWVNEKSGYRRETDVMPAVAGSSWYYLRFMDPHNSDAFVSSDNVKYWQDVDLYIGGAEHAVSHLLYARFWHKFLYDLGYVPGNEPFKKLINQGMIQGGIEFIFLDKRDSESSPESRFVSPEIANLEGMEHFAKIPVHVDFVTDYGSDDSYLDLEGLKAFLQWRPDYTQAVFESGQGSVHFVHGNISSVTPNFKMETLSEVGKMSKSLFNVINPDTVIAQYGTDCFRMYEMFLGPISQSKPWDIQGIDGVSKFLKRLWSLFYDSDGNWKIKDQEPDKNHLKILHTCLKQVQEDIERFSFNTCVSAFMIAVNELKKTNCTSRRVYGDLLKALAPFAPHMSEELWQRMHIDQSELASIHLAEFPDFEAKHLIEDHIVYPLCINGKKRANIEIESGLGHDEIEKKALENVDIQKWIEGKTVRKVIVVPNRMINMVVS